MRSIKLRIRLPASSPPLLEGERLSAYGIVLRERIGSLAVKWPAVGFHRIQIGARTITVTLIPHPSADPRATGVAIGRAVTGEIN